MKFKDAAALCFTVAIIATFLALVAHFCSGRENPEILPPSPSVSASTSSPPPSSVSAPEPDPSQSPITETVVLGEIPVAAAYTSGDGTLAVITSKGAAVHWGIPYPHRLVLSTKDDLEIEDCGFFPTLEGDGWRTAFCLIKNERVAQKLYVRSWDGVLDFEIIGGDLVRKYPGFKQDGQETPSSQVP